LWREQQGDRYTRADEGSGFCTDHRTCRSRCRSVKCGGRNGTGEQRPGGNHRARNDDQ